MKVKFVNITEEDFFKDSFLFKVVSNEYISETVDKKNNYLWFSNPDKWKDPYEKFYLDATYQKEKDGEYLPFPLKGRIYGACFSSARFMEPQWIMYSDNFNGKSYGLSVSRKKLIKGLEKCDKIKDENGNEHEIESIYIGKVKYVSKSDLKAALISKNNYSIDNEEDLIKIMLYKRNAFLYEDEIRVFIITKDKSDNSEGLKFHDYNPVELFETIAISPFSSIQECGIDWESFGFVERINSKGVPYNPIQQSKLYDEIKTPVIKLGQSK